MWALLRPIEERPHGDRPVAIEPRPYQFLRAGGPQPLLVRHNVNVRSHRGRKPRSPDTAELWWNIGAAEFLHPYF